VTRPKFLDDLYRDLKDRRLLPLVGLLVVAIIAVPIVLSVSSDTSLPAGSAEIVPADAPEAQSAVLAENPGLRNYKQRLEALKAKNPFQQQFEFSGLDETSVEGTVEGSGVVAETGSGTVSSDGGSVEVGSTSGATSTETTTPSTNVETTPEETKIRFYTHRVDLTYGVEGDVKQEKNVKVLDLLDPVGAFIGASEDGAHAFFMLSTDVIAASGEGKCVPAPSHCEFLSLEEGQSETLTYQPASGPDITPGPVNYRLGVDDIRLVKIKKPTIEE
jgi:hypothetical protein